MTASLTDLARRLRFHEGVLAATTAGFAAADWAHVPSAKGGNTPHWILGHLAGTRRFLARQLGAAVPEEPWEALFAYGAGPAGTAGYPDPGALAADFAAIGARIYARLAELTEAEAAAEWGGSFPDGSHTLEGGAAYLHFHEAYHLGQLGLLRRLLGHPGLV